MVRAEMPNEALLPRDSGGMGPGVAISLAVHAVLAAALAGVVQWRTQSPNVVAAELWASVPERAAAPAPPPPAAPAPAPVPAPAPPPPAAQTARPPDIATEREQRQRAERERQERADRERQASAERELRERRERQERERREQEARIEQSRQEQLRRMMAQAGTAASTAGQAATGSAARDAAPSASYVARLASLIRGNTVFSGEVPGNPAAEVEVRAAAGGAIIARRLVKSSGHAAWDDAVLRAIDKTARLPPDTDGRVPPVLLIAFRPKE